MDNRIEVYVYVPCKGYMIGMPMRDISAVEWESLPQELKEAALKQGLYILHKTKKEVKDA